MAIRTLSGKSDYPHLRLACTRHVRGECLARRLSPPRLRSQRASKWCRLAPRSISFQVEGYRRQPTGWHDDGSPRADVARSPVWSKTRCSFTALRTSGSAPAYPADCPRSDWLSGPSMSGLAPTYPAGCPRSDWRSAGLKVATQGARNVRPTSWEPKLIYLSPRRFQWQLGTEANNRHRHSNDLATNMHFLPLRVCS